MHQPIRLYFAVWIGVLCLIAANDRAFAQDLPPPVRIHVYSILAAYAQNRSAPGSPSGVSPSEVKMDKRLVADGIGERLTRLFDYANYQLIRHQDEESPCGEAVAFNLPGGHILHVAPLGFEDNELVMELAMFEGPRLIMQMPLRMDGGGMFLLLDHHFDNRVYITAIAADSPQLLRPRPGLGAAAQPDNSKGFTGLIPVQ